MGERRRENVGGRKVEYKREEENEEGRKEE